MRNLQISLLSTAALSVLLAAPTTAQLGQEQNAGIGVIKRSFNMTELAGTLPDTDADGRITGVAFLDGLLYVSGRNGVSSDDHRIYIVDPNTTTLMGYFSVPEPLQSTSWGARDLDTDLAGNLVAGSEDGVFVMDKSGNLLDTIVGAGGPVALSMEDFDGTMYPVIGNQQGALDELDDSGGSRDFEAMGFDPNGDGGNGSVFVAQGLDDGDFYELRISDATIVRAFAPGPDSNGLAIDPISGQLWCNASGDNTPGNVIVEMDLNGSVDADMDGFWDLLETGNTVAKLRQDFADNDPLSGDDLGRTYGGIDFMPGGDPVASPLYGASAWDLVQVSQNDEQSNGTDFIAISRVHQFPGVLGYAESQLRGSVGADPIANLSPVLYGEGDTLNWGMVSNGRPNGFGPALIVLNFGADAKVDGVTNIGGVFPELVAINFASFPPPVVGEVIQNTQVDFKTTVPLPPGFAVTTGDVIRLQSVYFEPASPTLNGLASSNELWFLGTNIKEVMIEMDAPNPYHVDLVNPSFRVTELTGDPAKAITKVIFDVGSTNGLLPEDAWFDVDEPQMYDYFGAGNGTVYGCKGTYRAGSDVATGLIYAGTDVMAWLSDRLPCADEFREVDGMGNPIDPISGFLGSDRNGGNARVPRIVEFNFTPGMFVGNMFGFDADLDSGGAGLLNGGSMRDWAGTWVRVERADGSSFEGVLFPDSDPNFPNRALTGF